MSNQLPMKIVLCGPAHSGKSCLRHGLKDAIREINDAPYPYVITAVPDGEGSWYHETAGADLELATTLKKAYKTAFTYEQANKFQEWVSNCKEPLVLIDIGGIPDDKNIKICQDASHAILIAGDLQSLTPWRRFCERTELEIIAELHSDYHAQQDFVQEGTDDQVFRASVHHLERGDLTIKDRPAIKALANHVVKLSQSR